MTEKNARRFLLPPDRGNNVGGGVPGWCFRHQPGFPLAYSWEWFRIESRLCAPADVKRGIDVRLRFDLRRHQGSKPESAAVGCPVSRCASPPSRRWFRRQSVRYFDRYRGSSSFFHSQTKKGGHGQRTHDRLWKFVRAAQNKSKTVLHIIITIPIFMLRTVLSSEFLWGYCNVFCRTCREKRLQEPIRPAHIIGNRPGLHAVERIIELLRHRTDRPIRDLNIRAHHI